MPARLSMLPMAMPAGHVKPMRCLPGRFLDSGGVYKLAFGPKAFIVVSDPVVVRHLLKVRPPLLPTYLHATPLNASYARAAAAGPCCKRATCARRQPEVHLLTMILKTQH